MTRQNLCPNPSAKNDATGWGGTAAPTRVTGLAGFPRTTGMKSTGTGYITSPVGACGPGDSLVVSLYQQSPTALGNKTVYAAFTRSAGGDDFSQTFLTNLDSTVIRTSATVTAPALATGVYLLLDGVPADVVVAGVMYEPGTVDGGYADGDTSGWTWDGTDGNSPSTESSVSLSTTVTMGGTQALTLDGALGTAVGAGGIQALTLAGTVSYATTVTMGGTQTLALDGALGSAVSAGGTQALALAGQLSYGMTMGGVQALTLDGSVTGGTVETPAGWETIRGAINEAWAQHRKHDERRKRPIDCPVHLWPLEIVGNVYHCKFGGHTVKLPAPSP